MRWILGIDPGQNGGLVLRDPQGAIIACDKMPATERDLFDSLNEYMNMVVEYSTADTLFCYLEKVGARPMQGAAGMWKFAEHYGNLRMALTALLIPYELVLPNTWQKFFSCQTKGDKKVTYRKAQEMFPSIKTTHWNADALLISEYGVKKK